MLSVKILVSNQFVHKGKAIKKAFTLLELLVVLAVVGVLLGVAVPSYNNQVLKGRFEEAKLIIQAMMMAQERYHYEHGIYYTVTTGTIDNEDLIHNNLKVDFTSSNNFIFTLVASDDLQSYRIKAMLRDDSWNVCTDLDPDSLCKQTGTQDEDSWVGSYNTSTSTHYIEARFPVPLPDSVGGIDYTHLYTGD
jgi:prepilin-type N-terminal cleavage/methylation domain-containing protein